MHSTKKPAILFKDGYQLHYIHGVFFEPELFQKLCIDKTVTLKDILSWTNAEQRSAAITLIGYEKLFAQAGTDAKLLDKTQVRSKVTRKMTTYELYDITIANTPCRFVSVECHTIHKKTFLGVPATDQTKTCMAAIAWTFRMTEAEYNPKKET